MIISKRTKLTKSGDTMAFLRVEDKYSEIEVIVFAKQYAKSSEMLSVDSAVYIEGTISVEEGEEPKILLSSAFPLQSNMDFALNRSATAPTVNDKPSEKRIFIKVDSISDERINTIYRIAAFNKGETKVVLFDSSTKKYSVMRSLGVEATEKVISKLEGVFSKENVIFK